MTDKPKIAVFRSGWVCSDSQTISFAASPKEAYEFWSRHRLRYTYGAKPYELGVQAKKDLGDGVTRYNGS